MDITTFYGATWCPDCKRAQAFLDEQGVPYTVTDIDTNPEAAQEVVKINKGYRTIPTIVFSDGSSLSEPSNQQLAEKLGLSKS